MYDRTTRIIKILNDTADYFVDHRWGKGEFYAPKKDACCVAGGLRVAAGGTPDANSGNVLNFDYSDYANAIASLQIEVGEDVYSWNDKQRDKRKVIRALRRTARKLEAQLANAA